MGYRIENLNDNEHIALDFRPHWWYFSHHIVTGVPLAIFGFLVLNLGSGWLDTGVRYVFCTLFVAWLLGLAIKFVSWRFTNFMVSNQRVVYRTGAIARHGVEIPLNRIANINFDQSMWTRLIGAGSLIIESAGREGNTRFADIRHPDGVQRVIYREMDAAELQSAERIGQATARQSRPASDSVAAEITALIALRDAGELTPEEFAQQRERLLSGS